MSSSFGVGAARRVRRAAALLGLLVAGAVGAGVVVAPSAAAADAVPTMTFNGSLNVLGLLNSLTVTPASVSVPAAGRVRFVNSSPSNLQLTVGGRQFPFPSKGTQTLVFPGATTPQPVTAQAAPLAGAVGGLLASTGTVNVGAAPKAQPPAPQPQQPAPQRPPAGSEGSDAGTPSTPGGPAQPGTNGTVMPQALVKLPPNFGRDPVARGGMASAGLPPITEEEAGSASQGTTAAPDRPSARSDNAASAEGAVTMVGGGIGLLILVATVLLGGVGAAAIRTVLAQRGAEMRA